MVEEVSSIAAPASSSPWPFAAALLLLEDKFSEHPWNQPGFYQEGRRVQNIVYVFMIIVLLGMCFIALPFAGLIGEDDYGGGFLGRTVRAGFHNFDRRILGVRTDIRSLTVHPLDGFVDVEGLEINNPDGYSSPYLLKARTVMVDLDMPLLVRSGFKVISIQNLIFQDVHAILEQKLDGSNMEDVLNYIQGTVPPLELEDDVVYAIHHVAMENVSITVRPSGPIGEYIYADVAAADVNYKDFSAEVGETYMNEIVRELLKTLLKTLISGVAGKQVGRYLVA